MKQLTSGPPEAPKQVSLHRREKAPLIASSARRVVTERPTAEKPIIISASELGSFLRCRVQHYWSYQVGLMHPQKNAPQSIGTLGHIMLERWYGLPVAKRGPKAMRRIARQANIESRSMPTSEMLITDTDRTLLEAMCVGYTEWVQRSDVEYSDRNIGLKEFAPEEWFDLPLAKDGSIRVRGKLDNRFFPAKYKKTVAIVESKFKKSIAYDPIQNRLQLTVYLWALRERFPEMKRFQAYPQILRKQMPGPRVKADLFWRDMIERSADEIDQWKIDTAHIAMDMLDGAVYPSPMDSCSWMCSFAAPCQLRGSKSDLLHVLKETYIRREK